MCRLDPVDHATCIAELAGAGRVVAGGGALLPLLQAGCTGLLARRGTESDGAVAALLLRPLPPRSPVEEPLALQTGLQVCLSS